MSSPRIVLIDDDAALLDVLSLAFEDAAYDVSSASDGIAGLARIAIGADLVITDVNMPLLDGFALVRRLRAAGNSVPVIVLTSRDNEIDEALALDLGADDYVAKPFSTRVLLARAAALLRRGSARLEASDGTSRVLRVGPLELHPERLEVRLEGTLITVTVTEFKLLEALCARPGVVFSRTQLMEHSRGDDSVVAERIVDTYVRRLRRKFETVQPAFASLETVVGAGYRWRSP